MLVRLIWSTAGRLSFPTSPFILVYLTQSIFMFSEDTETRLLMLCNEFLFRITFYWFCDRTAPLNSQIDNNGVYRVFVTLIVYSLSHKLQWTELLSREFEEPLSKQYHSSLNYYGTQIWAIVKQCYILSCLVNVSQGVAYIICILW